MTDEKAKVEVINSDNFKQFYAIGAIGGHNLYDFRMAFYNDLTKRAKEGDAKIIERSIEIEIILSPPAAKELALWLMSHVKDYENKFGVIRPSNEVVNQSTIEKSKQSQKSEPVSYIG